MRGTTVQTPTKVGGEGGEGGDEDSGIEILLWTVLQTMSEAAVLQPIEDHRDAEIHHSLWGIPPWSSSFFPAIISSGWLGLGQWQVCLGPAGIDIVGHEKDFWQLLTEATHVSHLLPNLDHANPIQEKRIYLIARSYMKSKRDHDTVTY
ncbi:hypothetical protein HGM15179_010744 [Zosterops borbonicus]|uniref:Uncharacterized protein n=1 Tax=Zosterops borbonicus TaxID=364589 RepID=A0A8K1GCW4_9PASS|nr:hypothetical protein HGM15179_010744 [Zosterops borbonicus]